MQQFRQMKYSVALNGNLENICEKYRLKPLDYEMAGGTVRSGQVALPSSQHASAEPAPAEPERPASAEPERTNPFETHAEAKSSEKVALPSSLLSSAEPALAADLKAAGSHYAQAI